jgi:hypothetical protein
MIGPTNLQKRLFGFLWAGAKFSGLKSHRLILAEAARELGATETGIKKVAEQLRDAWHLIWFDKTNLGRAGWAEVRFPRQPWMPRIPNRVRDYPKKPNPEQTFQNPEQSSQNPEHSSSRREGECPQRIRRTERRERIEIPKTSRSGYDGPDW